MNTSTTRLRYMVDATMPATTQRAATARCCYSAVRCLMRLTRPLGLARLARDAAAAAGQGPASAEASDGCLTRC